MVILNSDLFLFTLFQAFYQRRGVEQDPAFLFIRSGLVSPYHNWNQKLHLFVELPFMLTLYKKPNSCLNCTKKKNNSKFLNAQVLCNGRHNLCFQKTVWVNSPTGSSTLLPGICSVFCKEQWASSQHRDVLRTQTATLVTRGSNLGSSKWSPNTRVT